MWQVDSERAFSMRFISYGLIKFVLATVVGVCLRSSWQENEPPCLRVSLTGLRQESEPPWLRATLMGLEQECYGLCYIFVPRVDLSQLLTLSVQPDRLTAVYRTHFGCCRYLDT
jgi:hypothetical protein